MVDVETLDEIDSSTLRGYVCLGPLMVVPSLWILHSSEGLGGLLRDRRTPRMSKVCPLRDGSVFFFFY